MGVDEGDCHLSSYLKSQGKWKRTATHLATFKDRHGQPRMVSILLTFMHYKEGCLLFCNFMKWTEMELCLEKRRCSCFYFSGMVNSLAKTVYLYCRKE